MVIWLDFYFDFFLSLLIFVNGKLCSMAYCKILRCSICSLDPLYIIILYLFMYYHSINAIFQNLFESIFFLVATYQSQFCYLYEFVKISLMSCKSLTIKMLVSMSKLVNNWFLIFYHWDFRTINKYIGIPTCLDSF